MLSSKDRRKRYERSDNGKERHRIAARAYERRRAGTMMPGPCSVCGQVNKTRLRAPDPRDERSWHWLCHFHWSQSIGQTLARAGRYHGNPFYEARIARNMTRAQLGALTEISPVWILRLESEPKRLLAGTLEQTLRLAVALDMGAQEVFDYCHKHLPAPPAASKNARGPVKPHSRPQHKTASSKPAEPLAPEAGDGGESCREAE
jgi:transcriptional regulator with XRE-family HTH domain